MQDEEDTNPLHAPLVPGGGAIVVVVLIGLLGWIGWSVFERYSSERELVATVVLRDAKASVEGAWSAHVLRVPIEVGQTAQFELCATTPAQITRATEELEFAVWVPQDNFVLVHLDRGDSEASGSSRLSPSELGWCAVLAVGEVPRTGNFAFEAIGDSRSSDRVLDTPLIGRVRTFVPMDIFDGLRVTGLAILAALFAALVLRSNFMFAPSGGEAGLITSLAIGGALVLSMFTGSDPPTSFLRALGILLLLVVPPLFVMRREDSTAHASVLAHIAYVAGGVAVGFAAVAGLIVSPFEEQTVVMDLVSWPSGLLAASAIAVVAPWGEEFFFRGFLYGALERYGLVVAGVVSAALFVVAHFVQTGASPALIGVCLLAMATTLARANGATIFCCGLLHLGYNIVLLVI